MSDSAKEGARLWQDVIAKEFQDRQVDRLAKKAKKVKFPLIDETYTKEDVLFMMEPLLNGQLTMAENVRNFEKKFANYVGAKYAVMVNSGSSANLLGLAAMMSYTRKKEDRLMPGDEVICPSVCWSTSLFPITQLGMKPVLCDTDPTTMNIDIQDFVRKITDKTRAVIIVHVLGNCANMDLVMEVCKKHKLQVLEDTCESLGSRYKGQMLGTFGEVGSYSFYFSHHLTTGEGGACVTNSLELYDLLKCMRAHGWSRELSNIKELEQQNPDIDPRFLFVNAGFNLRPMEMSGALGIRQLDRIEYNNATRNLNRQAIIDCMLKHPKYDGQIEFIGPMENSHIAWFGLVMMLKPSFMYLRHKYAQHLTSKGVENRPIISGNFASQPALKGLGINVKASDFPQAQQIGERGIFIGLHVSPLAPEMVSELIDIMMDFDFKPQDIVLVTGGTGTVGRGIQQLVEQDPSASKARKWVFVGSKQADFTSFDSTSKLFDTVRPTHVMHLAAVIKGRHEMSKQKAEIFDANMAINQNILRCARKYQVKKLVSCLSSTTYPVAKLEGATEAELTTGPPAEAVSGYANSKRMLDFLTKSMRDQHGVDFVTVCPTNIFGGTSALRLDGPLFEANFAKVLVAKEAGEAYKVWGTGEPRRQLLYSKDLAKMLVWALDSYSDGETLNLTGTEVSVREIAEALAKACKFEGKMEFETDKPDGPKRVAISDEKFQRLCPGLKPTLFSQAVNEIVQEYMGATKGTNGHVNGKNGH